MMNRIRLLKFMGLFAIGGTERQVVSLAGGLDRSRFDLQMACFDQTGLFRHDVEALGIPVSEFRINCLYDWNAMRQRFRFARLLRKNRVQVVHSYGFYSTAFALPAAKLAGVPVVIASIRDTGELLTDRQKRVQKLACRMADSVMVNAEAVRKWLVKDGYAEQKITVIRNGIDAERFQTSGTPGGARRSLGIPPQGPLIAMCSRLNRLKGVEYFVEAAAAVAARFPEARFLIVGDVGCGEQSYGDNLKRQAAHLGLGDRIIFTGFRLDVSELLSDVTISVLPSLSEGLSNVLLEAMAAGAPVIATNVGGNPEVVQDGVTGFIVPPADAASLAGAMSFLIENPELARQYGRAGRQRIAEHFQMEHMVRQTEQHYVRLLAQTMPKHAPGTAEVPA